MKSQMADVELKKFVEHAYASLPRKEVYNAVRHLFPQKTNSPDLYGYAFDLMVYCLATTHDDPNYVLSEVTKLIHDEASCNGESYWLHNLIGCHKYNINENDHDAYVHFGLGSAKLRGFSEVHHISCGMDCIRHPSFDPFYYSEVIKSQNLHFIPKKLERYEITHLVAADSVYFARYIKRLITSMMDHVENRVCLCAILVNPTNETKLLAEDLCRTIPWFYCAFTYQEFPDMVTNRSVRAFYASARFIFAENVIKKMNSPLVITDIDVLIKNSYDATIAAVSSNPASFSTGVALSKKFYPWLRVSAGLVLAQDSAKGKEILKYLSRYISATYDRSPMAKNWLIDQIALVSTLRTFSNDIGRTRIGLLCENVK